MTTTTASLPLQPGLTVAAASTLRVAAVPSRRRSFRRRCSPARYCSKPSGPATALLTGLTAPRLAIREGTSEATRKSFHFGVAAGRSRRSCEIQCRVRKSFRGVGLETCLVISHAHRIAIKDEGTSTSARRGPRAPAALLAAGVGACGAPLLRFEGFCGAKKAGLQKPAICFFFFFLQNSRGWRGAALFARIMIACFLDYFLLSFSFLCKKPP